MFNDNEYLRYARHFSLHNVGISGQEKLKNAKVLCVGCGGLAASTVTYLAASGIGTLGIIDDDIVDESNLQRQIQFNTTDIGISKVIATARRINELNPHIQVYPYNTKLTETNVLDIIGKFDIIIDCTDNFYSKYLINDACFELRKPFVYASVFQFEGQIGFFDGKNSPCFRCLYISPPESNMMPNCTEEGILGVVPGLLGIMEAIEVIKYILGLGENLSGKLLFFDTLTMTLTPLKFMKSSNCPLCVEKKNFYELTRLQDTSCNLLKLPQISAEQLSTVINDVVLIDVREEYEHQICNIGGYLIPLKSLDSAISRLDKNSQIVVYCKSGKRSQDAAKLMMDAGFSNVSFLNGGIISWINHIDSSLKRY